MNGSVIGLIIVLVLLLVLVGIVYYAYIRIRNKIRYYSRAILGTSDLVQGIKSRELENASTPKSVSSATNLYLPQIMRDFPEFHYDEMKTRAENVLTSYLRGVDAMDAEVLTEGTDELRDNLNMRIQMLRNADQREIFQKIKVHRTEINRYRKTKGRCSVVFQSSIEYIHYVEKNGNVTAGRKDLKEQSKYNVELIYIQDRETVENMGGSGLGLNCPNCGAPLPGLGAKKCLYCDSPVIEFNIRTWGFSSVKEVR